MTAPKLRKALLAVVALCDRFQRAPDALERRFELTLSDHQRGVADGVARACDAVRALVLQALNEERNAPEPTFVDGLEWAEKHVREHATEMSHGGASGRETACLLTDIADDIRAEIERAKEEVTRG